MSDFMIIDLQRLFFRLLLANLLQRISRD